MNAFRRRPNRYPWPPVILAAALAAAALLSIFLPLPFAAPEPLWLYVAGAVVALCGIVLDVWAMMTLHDGGTTIMPHRPSHHLVTGGPYAFSRNPIYLGNALLLAGIGIAAASPWFLLAALFAALLTQRLAIEREERHLLARFGAEFEVYCRKTRRWL